MKAKIFFLALAAALSFSSMQAQKGLESKDAYKTIQPKVVVGKVALNTPFAGTMFMSPAKADVPAGMAMITLHADDVWQDGTGYQMLLDADANTFGTVIPETGGLTSYGDASAATYAEFEYKIPEDADGAMTTTNVVIDNTISILIPAGVYDWCITNPTPDDRIWIASSNGNIPGRFDDYEFADGGIYTFSVTLGGTNDRVDLDIYDPNAPVMPENLAAITVEPNSAEVAWENDHDPLFNLRYRVYVPTAAQSFVWDFETDESLEGWSIWDYDQDGYNWGITSSYAHSGNNAAMSQSYDYGSVLYPDNWLISPEVPLNGSLSLWAGQVLTSWPDVFAVYVCIGEVEDEESLIKISDDLAPTEWTNYTFDLSEFEGQMGHFVIRHYNCYDQYALLIDDITLDVPGDPLNEWIVVEGIDDPNYVIEGLDPETTYEVQVQAVAEDGRTSAWTNSVIFTTPEEGDVPPTVQADAPEIGVAYGTDGNHVATVTINTNEENATIYYSYDNENWMVYDGELLFTEDGVYMVYAYVAVPGKLDSEVNYVRFVVTPQTGMTDLTTGKTIASQRFYNAMGQEMSQANGLTIIVTTYTDGTTNAVKVMK